MARRALITGVSGQDGTYLAELLVGEGYAVFGLVRDPSAGRPSWVPEEVELVAGDLADHASLAAAVASVAPDELYHLAAPTFVPASWEDPSGVLDAVAGATGALLAAARRVGPSTRVFVASSAEVFGDAGESPQHERSPMRPRSPYGVAKLAAHGLCGAMREHHGQFVVSGIAYNHESPRRPERFVTRKITRGAAALALGLEDELRLGDLAAVRDWSHARDVVRAAWLALQAPEPRDYVVASGVGRTVGDFVAAAFGAAGVAEAVGDGRVVVDPAFVRAPEPTVLVGDPSRARRELGWEPSCSFEELVGEMVAADLAALRVSAGAGG
ncbi:GDP-mannose 4,6-dehydratase [Conexibacter sp. SYSU D00693]|uniref:GDP-mannose 4,6-dehydratase n=1 Tax=Conexibacter sp. SYSU D00693 TaxID=2812560 RepID=UPI00196B00F4|nr:GDP-mannose 4,6-dehydratase [Conexibacter sp. SYSU D00693]